MKRKFVCTVITLMCLFMSACGNQNDNKETENYTTNVEGTKEDNKDESTTNIEGSIEGNKDESTTNIEGSEEGNKDENTTNDLTKYYDTSEFVGNPYLEHGYVVVGTNPYTGEKSYSIVFCDSIEEFQECVKTGNFKGISIDETYGVDAGEIECIIVDNGTPDDFSDDKLAYILEYIPYSEISE